MFAPIEIGAPLVFGLVAATFGLLPALALLLLEPLAVAGALWATRPRRITPT